MKKLTAAILALALLLGCASVTAESTKEAACAEEGFTVRIPAGTSAVYEANNGLVVYTETEGYIPYVIVHRRTADMKFSDPVNFLNNVYREHLEDKYGDDMLGMNPAKDWEAGGKTLKGARYMYKVQDTTICMVRLIEVRDDGDVEYTAKYIDRQGDATMAALDEIARSYRTGEEAPAEAGGVLLPEPVSSEVDTEYGYYCADIRDTDKIPDGGYFTLGLYEPSLYAEEGVKALKAGSKVQVNGTEYTVASLEERDAGIYELITQEEFDGYIVFRYEKVGYFSALVNDWVPCTFVADYKVMMPLANKFVLEWESPDGEGTSYDADAFVTLVTEEGSEDMNRYNTSVEFAGGLLFRIRHSDYPPGPDFE